MVFRKVFYIGKKKVKMGLLAESFKGGRGSSREKKAWD